MLETSPAGNEHVSRVSGKPRGRRKLTEADVNRIWALSETQSQRKIARDFGINQKTVSKILKGKIWLKHYQYWMVRRDARRTREIESAAPPSPCDGCKLADYCAENHTGCDAWESYLRYGVYGAVDRGKSLRDIRLVEITRMSSSDAAEVYHRFVEGGYSTILGLPATTKVIDCLVKQVNNEAD